MRIPIIGRILRQVGSAMSRGGATRGRRRTPAGVGARGTRRGRGGIMSMVRRFLR